MNNTDTLKGRKGEIKVEEGWEEGGREGREREGGKEIGRKDGRKKGKKEGGGETEEERESGRKGGMERGRGKQQHLSPSCRFCGRQPAYGSENLHHLKVGLGKKPTGDLGRQQPTPFLWVP